MSDHTPPDHLPRLVDELERKVHVDEAVTDEDDVKQPPVPDHTPAVPGAPEPAD